MRIERSWDVKISRHDYFWPVCRKIAFLNEHLAVVVRESPANVYARGVAEEWTTESGHTILLYENEVAYEYTLEEILLLLESVEENERIIAGDWIIDSVDPRIVEALKDKVAYFTCRQLDD
jgi:hypothetical protein